MGIYGELSSLQELLNGKASEIEYCGTKKPLVRSFEPSIAENGASECIEESHRVNFTSDSLL